MRRLASGRLLALAGTVIAVSGAAPSGEAAAPKLPSPDLVQRSWPAVPAPVAVAAPSRAGGAMIARIVAGAYTRSEPDGGHRIWYAGAATSMSGEPQTLLVMGSAEVHGQEWLQLLLPVRPDGSTGWFPRANVSLTSTDYWVQVNLGERTVDVFRAGQLIEHYRAVVGKPSTPTPTGLAAIYERDRQPDPHGFLGPWAMPLTLLSDALRRFDGGPGRVAIHGRDGASLENPLGTAASHGCVRIDNGPITWMATHLPAGAPVDIERSEAVPSTARPAQMAAESERLSAGALAVKQPLSR